MPPYADESVEEPMIVPFALVVRIWLGIWKRVVEPVLLMENSVEVAKLAVEDEMTKKLSGEPSVVVPEKSASLAYGVVVPSPRFPVAPSNTNGEIPAFPNRTVLDAYNPPWSCSAVVVALVTVEAYEPGVKLNPAFASVPQESIPAVDALTSQLAALRFETTSAVVLAVPVTAMLVVVAFVALIALEKKFVDVAFCSVVEPMTSRLPVVVAPPKMVRPVP